MNQKKRRIKKIKTLFLEIGLTLFVTLGVVYLLSLFTFSLARVEGYSMSDTLEDSDVVVVNKLAKIKRFDLVYIHVPNSSDKSVRRIIGRPGESLYYKNGQLFINEEEKEERFIADYKNQFEKDGMMFTEDFTLKSLTGEVTIPKDKYLVLGDNRPYATDSRYYQLVDKKEVIGTVEMRVLPLHKLQRF
nr:signal peptidase I [Enterococcus sp. DIV0212c]MBO1353081.1 signal peptidase I [Enterococcus sp. DIV0212c]